MKKDFLKTATFNQNVFIDENIVAIPIYSNNIIRLLDVVENGAPVKNKKIIVDSTLLDEDYRESSELKNVMPQEGSLGLYFLVDLSNIMVDDICTDVTPEDIVGIIADEEGLHRDLNEFKLDLYGAGTYTNYICADVVNLMKENHGYEFDYSKLEELLVRANGIDITSEDREMIMLSKLEAIYELDMYISLCICEFLSSRIDKEYITLKDVIDHFTTRTMPIYNKEGNLIDKSNRVEKLAYAKKKL